LTSSWKIGAVSGLIAGIITSIIPLVTDYAFSTLGISQWLVGIDFLFKKIIVHILNNAIWGVIFSLILIMFFDRIPGKWIKKGLIFGLILSLFAVIRPTFFVITYGFPIFGSVYMLGYTIDKFIYGILFAALYKR
jgi:hypothetical protein